MRRVAQRPAAVWDDRRSSMHDARALRAAVQRRFTEGVLGDTTEEERTRAWTATIRCTFCRLVDPARIVDDEGGKRDPLKLIRSSVGEQHGRLHGDGGTTSSHSLSVHTHLSPLPLLTLCIVAVVGVLVVRVRRRAVGGAASGLTSPHLVAWGE